MYSLVLYSNIFYLCVGTVVEISMLSVDIMLNIIMFVEKKLVEFDVFI